MKCNIDLHLSQKLVQGPGLGSDHRGGQRLAPCPPDHHLGEEDGVEDEEYYEESAASDEKEENYGENLEAGKHDEVLHLDNRVDDDDDIYIDDDDDEHLEEGKHDEVLHPDADVDDRVEPTERWTEVPLA